MVVFEIQCIQLISLEWNLLMENLGWLSSSMDVSDRRDERTFKRKMIERGM
jgi:hypothetical protein